MGRIFKEFRSVSGAILGVTILLIGTFWVWNFLQTRGGPVSGPSGWIFGHATGQAYAPQNAAPAMTTSPYSVNNNLGPQI